MEPDLRRPRPRRPRPAPPRRRRRPLRRRSRRARRARPGLRRHARRRAPPLRRLRRAQPRSGTPPDADTAFRICSMTKSFMAMTLLSLREEGRLDIDAPLGEIAPDLRRAGAGGPGRPGRHRAPAAHDGCRPAAGRSLGRPPDGRGHGLGARAPVRARRHALARAGTHFEYSNYRWAALGRVVATVTGRRHQDVVRERVPRAARARRRSLERRRPAVAADRHGLPRPARASRRRCRWPTAVTSPRSAGLQQRARPRRAGAACSWTPSAPRCPRERAREPRDAA